MNLDELIMMLLGSKGGQGQPQMPDPARFGGVQGPVSPNDMGLYTGPPPPESARWGGSPSAGKGDRVGADLPVTPPGVRMPQMGPTDYQPQTIDQARMDAANAPKASTASPFNPLQNAVDTAPTQGAPFNPLQNAVDTAPTQGAPFNPLQNAVDTAARPATSAELAQKIPPIQTSDLIPPITPQNTLSPLIPPITEKNTSAPTPTPKPAQKAKPKSKPARRAAPKPSPGRDRLAQLAAPQLFGRAADANYTTSGRGWKGKSSAIFGRGK